MVTLSCTVISLSVLSTPKLPSPSKRTIIAISKSQLERFFTRGVTPKPKQDVLPGKFLHLLNLSVAFSQVAEKIQKEVNAPALFLRCIVG